MKHKLRMKLWGGGALLLITIFGTGCLVQQTSEEDPDIFQFKSKTEVGNNVVVCNPQNQNCIATKAPQNKIFGLVRGGKFRDSEVRLCYPLLEDCQKEPIGPLAPRVQISLWAYKGDNEPHGGLIHQTTATEDGLYSFDPQNGDYWLTVYDSNNDRPLVKGYEKVFGTEKKFHLIKKITISEDQSQQYSIYLP